MTDLEVQLSKSLQRNLQHVVGPAGPTSNVRRSVKARRVSLVGGVVLALAALGLASTSLVSLAQDSAPLPAAPEPRPTLEQDLTIEPGPTLTKSPTIASQIEKGERRTIAAGKTWWLKGYIGLLPDGKDILCLDFRLGDGSTGFDCGGLQNGLSRGQEIDTGRITGQGPTAYFGIATRTVNSMEIELKDGSTAPGHLYEAPKDWDRIDQFFVAFAPAHEDKTLIARDSEGNVIARHSSSRYYR